MSFRSIAVRRSRLSNPSFLITVQRHPEHRATPSTSASDSTSVQGEWCLLLRAPLGTPAAGDEPSLAGLEPATSCSPARAPPGGAPFCAASSRTRASVAAGTSVASRRLYSTGSMAMRSRLRHLSFRSTADRDASAAATPFAWSDLMSAHCPRP